MGKNKTVKQFPSLMENPNAKKVPLEVKRFRRQSGHVYSIVDECCFKSCSVNTLRNYCGNDTTKYQLNTITKK